MRRADEILPNQIHSAEIESLQRDSFFYSHSVCVLRSLTLSLCMCSLLSVQCSKAQSNQIKWLDIWCARVPLSTCKMSAFLCNCLSPLYLISYDDDDVSKDFQTHTSYYNWVQITLNWTIPQRARCEREGELTKHTRAAWYNLSIVYFVHCIVCRAHNSNYTIFGCVSTTTINANLWQNRNLNFKFCWVYRCCVECILLQFYNSPCLLLLMHLLYCL